jgi:hypothetical protein
MTLRQSFNEREWALLGDAPLAAAAAVAMASPGGGRREADAMITGWREAGASVVASPLLAELVADLDPERRQGEGGAAGYAYDSIVDEAVDLCSRAVALLGRHAAAEDLEAYRSFVIALAERVAWASSESGFLGVGGNPMSPEERTMLGAVARALGYGRG